MVGDGKVRKSHAQYHGAVRAWSDTPDPRGRILIAAAGRRSCRKGTVMCMLGLRIWCGATVQKADVAALMPWLEWAYAEAKAEAQKSKAA